MPVLWCRDEYSVNLSIRKHVLTDALRPGYQGLDARGNRAVKGTRTRPDRTLESARDCVMI
jgi:hypothetical protein